MHVCVCIYVCVYSGMYVVRGNGWGVGRGGGGVMFPYNNSLHHVCLCNTTNHFAMIVILTLVMNCARTKAAGVHDSLT